MPTRIWLLLAPKTAAQGPKPSGAGTATPATRSGKTASKTAHFRSTSRAHTAGHSGGRARPARPKHWILSVDTDCAIAPLSIFGTPEPCLGDYPESMAAEDVPEHGNGPKNISSKVQEPRYKHATPGCTSSRNPGRSYRHVRLRR